jgi:hypothetical protein
MSAIGSAIETLFADPNLAREASYWVGGTGAALLVMVVARRPDQIIGFGETRLHSESAIFDVRVSEIADPRPGDTLELDGNSYVVQGEPVRSDPDRLVWTLDTRPA